MCCISYKGFFVLFLTYGILCAVLWPLLTTIISISCNSGITENRKSIAFSCFKPIALYSSLSRMNTVPCCRLALSHDCNSDVLDEMLPPRTKLASLHKCQSLVNTDSSKGLFISINSFIPGFVTGISFYQWWHSFLLIYPPCFVSIIKLLRILSCL